MLTFVLLSVGILIVIMLLVIMPCAECHNKESCYARDIVPCVIKTVFFMLTVVIPNVIMLSDFVFIVMLIIIILSII
jgi:hypothetical protein